ncbi:DinB family protein [Pedococcus aerophilus]|uniref:DinB family protein n=1 Tax=Pedococcus aerophilus TaxID=436356 RepID=A0ABN3UTH6_9MICO
MPTEPDTAAPTAPTAPTEREVLVEYLDHFRGVFERKCEGLTPEQLAARSVEPSTLSLLGLLRHLAKVEHIWFRITMEGNEIPRLYDADARDADFDGAVPDADVVAEAWEAWRCEVAHARSFVDAAPDLGVMSTHPTRQPISLRELLVHLVEEYARHCGHADLIRERIDGATGE